MKNQLVYTTYIRSTPKKAYGTPLPSPSLPANIGVALANISDWKKGIDLGHGDGRVRRRRFAHDRYGVEHASQTARAFLVDPENRRGCVAGHLWDQQDRQGPVFSPP